MTRASVFSYAFVTMLAIAGVAFAQQEDNNRRGGDRGADRGGDRGDRRNFDPAQFRERMMNRYKERLGIKDEEEWKAILPKLEKVMAVQRSARGGGGFGGGGAPGGFGGRGGGDRGGFGGGGDREQSPVSRASQELREALANESTPADTINQKLTAYRDARAKAREELAAAQKELRELLVQRQEATLVMEGLLD
jgi:hypothetical protein